jgi:hypothetical protein
MEIQRKKFEGFELTITKGEYGIMRGSNGLCKIFIRGTIPMLVIATGYTENESMAFVDALIYRDKERKCLQQ